MLSLEPPWRGPRDYLQEILACVDVALPNWSVRHLSIWSELVQPLALESTAADVEDVEEVTAEAQFQEVRSKIRNLGTP